MVLRYPELKVKTLRSDSFSLSGNLISDERSERRQLDGLRPVNFIDLITSMW